MIFRFKEEAELQKTLRDLSVTRPEDAVTTDARDRVNEGILDGPISEPSVALNRGEDPADPEVTTATYDCIAVHEETGSRIAGPGFTGTIDFESDEIRWNLGD